MTVKEPPERAPAASNSPLAQHREDFIQGGVRVLVDQGKYQGRVILQPRSAPPARFRRRATSLVPALHPFDRRTRSDFENFRSSAPRRPGCNRFDHALPQIIRIRPRHCLAPPKENQSRHTRPSLKLCESFPIQIHREVL
jgi:hypothetical protein